VQAKAKLPLKDAAAMNSTRWTLWRRLSALKLTLEVGTGGRTKWNRVQRGLPKAHWLDAACVGASTPMALEIHGIKPLQISAMGHGRRQMCITDKYGFPKAHRAREKSSLGFQTGDLVRTVIPRGKYAGVHAGRVIIRSKPWFRLNGFGVHPKHLTRLQRADGYDYTS
jgi:hypothetical protein